MIVPIAARSLAAVAGGALVIAAWASVIGTLVMPRRVTGWVTRWTDRIVDRAFLVVTGAVTGYAQRERVLVPQAAMMLIVQFVAWLGASYLGFTLLVWPFLAGGITQAFAVAGSAMSGIALSEPVTTVPLAILFAAATSGLVIVAPQIAYLPGLYGAYNRREPEVTLLNERAGVPPWGPELLARTYLGLGPDAAAFETLSDLYAQWERWAVDVADSHTAYLPLVRFRSSSPLTSWATALLAVLDSAALLLALCPRAAPAVPARLCLRSGYRCFARVARAMGLPVDEDPDPGRGISLSYEEFRSAVDRLREVDFPVERDPAEAWAEFIGWRANYEQSAYAVAKAIDAPPSMWSGTRRHQRGLAAIPPDQPPSG